MRFVPINEENKAPAFRFVPLEQAAPPQGEKIPAPPTAAQTSVPVGGEATGTVQRPRWMDHVDELDQLVTPRPPGFMSQLGQSFGVGIDQGATALSAINATAQDAAIKRTQERLERLIAEGQGESREAIGLQRTLDVYGQRQGSNLASLAQRQAGMASAPVYPGVAALGQAETFGDAWDVLKSDPLNIIANLGVQSLPTMAPGLAAGFINPVLGATVMGLSSGGVELGNSLMEFASSNGIDTSNPDQLRSFFANPGMLDEAKKFAATRAGIIGTVDAASAGLASKTLVPQAIKSPVARGVTNVGVQIPTQGAAGAAGEAGAQLATEGEITAPGEVVAEGAGGLFTAPVEVASMRSGVRREQAIKDQRQAAAGGVDESILNPAELLADAINFNVRRTETNPEAAQQAAINALSPDNAQMRAQPRFVPLEQPQQNTQQPLPMPDNMAAQAGGSFSEPGQTVQAGPGFTAANIIAGVGEPPESSTNQGDPDGLRQEGQETAQTQVLSKPTDRTDTAAVSPVYAGLSAVAQSETAKGLSISETRQAMQAYITQNAAAFADDAMAKAQVDSQMFDRAKRLYQEGKDDEAFAFLARYVDKAQVLNNDAFRQALKARVIGETPAPAAAPSPDTDRVQGILQRMREGNLSRPSMARANTSATAAEKASVEQMNVATSQAYEQAARQFLEGDLAGIKPNKANSLDIGLLNKLQDVRPLPIAKAAPLAKGFDGTLKALKPAVPTKDVRYYLNAIHLNEAKGRIEATDGHRLVVINQDVSGNLPARPQGVNGNVLVTLDGKWASDPKTGKPMDGKFPDVDRVLNLPGQSRTRTVSFDAAELAAQARGIAAAAKLFSQKIVPARVSIDGSQDAFQAQYLADMADIFRRLGYDRFNVNLSQESNGVLLATSPDGKVTQLIMSMRDPGTPFASIVGNDEKVFGEPKKPAAKKASPKKKAVKDFLADEGITDPAVVDAVAAEYDRLTGDDDVQDTDASDGAVAAQRGQEPADADAEQSGQQAAQPELFSTADAGRPAQDAQPQGRADQSQAGALDDRATVPAERDTGATASDRQGVSRDDGRQENQRIKGAGTDIFSAISFTNRQSIYKDAWIDLGQDPDQMAMLPPERQFKLLADGLSKTFGLSAVQRSNRSNIRLSIDQLQDAYRNMQFMAAALDLPTKAIGLNGTLALGLTSKGKYLGAYYPMGTDGRSSDGLVMEGATVVMPGRSNSFAHEWGHALDFYIVNAFEGSVDNLSGMVRKGESLSDTMPENVRDSFRLLMNSLFFDNAEMSAKIMDLERRIEAATQKGTDPTKLKADLERLRSGASQSRQGRSEFARSSGEFARAVGSDPGYWLKPTEMLARSFEAYVAHKVEAIGGTTEFIAKGDDAYMSDADIRLAKTFPKDSDRYNIFRSYDLLFDAIREQGLLNAAGDAVANVPANQRIFNPMVYYQAQIDSSTSERIAQTWQDERNAWAKHYRDTERLQNRPKDPRTLAQRIADAPAAAIHTNRGVLLSLEARYRRNGNVQAAEAIRNITKRLATDPGSGRETIQGGTFAEAVKNETRQRLNRLGLITKSNGYENYTDAQMAQLTDVLSSVGDEAVSASPQILKLANELRNLMDSTYYYNKNSGMDIGYVADVGYLPRIMDEPLVGGAPDRFLDVTGQVYDIVFERDTMRPDDVGVDIGEAIAALGTRIKAAGLDAKNDPSLQAYTEAVKELKKLNNALNQAIQRDDGDAVDAAQAALNEFIESNMDVFNDAYDYVKGEWTQKAAADYMSRVLYGASHQSFSSHSPQGSFTKRRVLPKEADKLLAEFYIQDPVERIQRYIEASVRKSEYTRLFGNGQLEKMIEALQKSRVLPEDQAVILDIVTQVTGTDQSRFPERLKATAGWIHTIGSMTVLGRVVLTSLVEPMTIAIQTGRPTDGIKSMLMLMEEAVNTKNVREQRAIAELLGIVTGDASNEIIMNRLGGTVGESRGMQKISGGFFRNVLLTPYDRASRRIAMRLTGRYIIELAADVDNPSTSAQQRRFAMDELRDAGMTDMEAQAFVAWVRELDGRLPGLYDLTDPGSGELTRMGKLYGLMVNRLSVQSIQDPTAIDRPWAANTVVGRMTFSLLSFSMGFMRNNIIKSLKRVGREYEAGGYTAAQSAALGSAGAFMMLYGGHFLVTALRELALNPDRWEEEKEKDNLTQWLAQLAFSRAGFTGLADPLYNAYLGVKYQRDLANIFLGAGNSYFTQAAERILKYWAVNSENTNSAERSAARGWYELLALPAMAMVTGSVPGRMMGYGAGLSYAYLSSPRAKEKVQDVVAGEKQGTKAKTGQGGQSSGAF